VQRSRAKDRRLVVGREGLGISWPQPFFLALIHRSAWKRNSPKFTVTSGRRYGFQDCHSLRTLSPPARFNGYLAMFAARNCYESLRLATVHHPENFLSVANSPKCLEAEKC
jgi:hypothetical protein